MKGIQDDVPSSCGLEFLPSWKRRIGCQCKELSFLNGEYHAEVALHRVPGRGDGFVFEVQGAFVPILEDPIGAFDDDRILRLSSRVVGNHQCRDRQCRYIRKLCRLKPRQSMKRNTLEIESKKMFRFQILLSTRIFIFLSKGIEDAPRPSDNRRLSVVILVLPGSSSRSPR